MANNNLISPPQFRISPQNPHVIERRNKHGDKDSWNYTYLYSTEEAAAQAVISLNKEYERWLVYFAQTGASE